MAAAPVDAPARERLAITPDEVCHLFPGPGQDSLCGETFVEARDGWCGEWDGLALCSGCGRPICPLCVRFAGLELALVRA